MTAFASLPKGVTRDNGLSGKKMIPPTVGGSVLENIRRRMDYLYERITRTASDTTEGSPDLTVWNPDAIGLYGTLATSDGFLWTQMKRRSENTGALTLDGADGAISAGSHRFEVENPYLGNAIPKCAWECDVSGVANVNYRIRPKFQIIEGVMYLQIFTPAVGLTDPEFFFQARWWLWELS